MRASVSAKSNRSRRSAIYNSPVNGVILDVHAAAAGNLERRRGSPTISDGW